MSRPRNDDTATLAAVYAEQGYLRKAAQIYRRLLAQDPAQPEVRAALQALRCEIAKRPVPSHKELGLMFKEWIHLLDHRRDNRRRFVKRTDQIDGTETP